MMVPQPGNGSHDIIGGCRHQTCGDTRNLRPNNFISPRWLNSYDGGNSRRGIGMRAFSLAIFVIAAGLAQSARADSAADILPLFTRNGCEQIKQPADQLFCGDPQLSAAATRLNGAIGARLNRVPNRRLAIEENAEWIRDRNSSCGILGRQPIKTDDIKPVRDCLLKETEERIDILVDPNFDCLAVHTTAGLLICSDASLALAKEELNELVMGVITRMKEDESKAALSEFDRWTRDRDRKCGLEGKDNVPLQELSPSEGCLAAYFNAKIAEVSAAKGDPKKIFGRQLMSPVPNADAVDLCVAQIQTAGACGNFLAVNRVSQIAGDKSDDSAQVTSAIEMIVLSPFTACSPIASSCTGTCWDMKTGKPKSTPGSREQFQIGYRLRIEKSFAFRKNNGGWNCSATTMQPVEVGVALSGP
jgi:uncharacterized protein YecT (DUF1311 family)